MSPFSEGPHCTSCVSVCMNMNMTTTDDGRCAEPDGPVLDPFLVKVLKADVKINPLIAPPADGGEDYLRWNMVFGTSNCYRTTDPRRSWVKGRNEPATHPRLSSMRLVSRPFPGVLTVRASSDRVGITCGELLDRIAQYLYTNVTPTEYDPVPKSRKRELHDAYHRNRSRDPNVPGGVLGVGMKKLDFLCKQSMFGGVAHQDEFVRERCGDALPCTFELKCLPSYPLTQQELRDQQSREREAEQRRSHSRSRSRGAQEQATAAAAAADE